MGSHQRILDLLMSHVGKTVSRDAIAAAAEIHEWARRIRELRADGWLIEESSEGYRLTSLEKGESKGVRANLDAKTRYRILHRDHGRCRRCGRVADDGVKLAVDHIMPVSWEPPNKDDDSNLWTLCEECNLGKKAWESDVDAAAMKAVLARSSGKDRILAYMQFKKGEVVTKEELQIVAGISEWARRIRELRDEGHPIVSMYENPDLRPGEYVYSA